MTILESLFIKKQSKPTKIQRMPVRVMPTGYAPSNRVSKYPYNKAGFPNGPKATAGNILRALVGTVIPKRYK